MIVKQGEGSEKMRKSTRNILWASGTIAGLSALGVMYHTSAKRLVKLALDREQPRATAKGKQRLSGSKKIGRLVPGALAQSKKLADKNHELISITGHDGIKLVGHWYECQDPKRVIIAMHGWRSSWSQDFGMISDFWEQNGCNVLYAEQRGQGESGGEHMGFGLLERYDCLDWIKWVNERTGSKLPIYLGGVSMGATTVLMASGLELAENVKGIVADCGFTSAHDIWKHVANNNLHIPYGIYNSAANDMCKKKIQFGANEYSTVDAMKVCRVPVLFVHGTDDRFVPVEMTYENFKSCKAPKHLLIVPGASHGMSYYIDKGRYEQAFRDFWDRYDG